MSYQKADCSFSEYCVLFLVNRSVVQYESAKAKRIIHTYIKYKLKR